MTLLLTGGTGLIGTALTHWAKDHSKEIRVPKRGSLLWNPDQNVCSEELFEGVDAVIHLGGENIAAKRWTASRKESLWNSRVLSTKLLVDTLARCVDRPKVLICASAVGWYGDQGDKILTEMSPSGSDFLSNLCQAWEHEAMRAEELGMRVVRLRLGVVLSGHGGLLSSLLPVFRFGGGGVLGSGKQWMSWVAIEDVVGMIAAILENPRLQGAINAVSPHPITNREFTKTLGSLLHRPTLFPCPAFLARLLFGEMADGLLLSSSRVLPQKMLQAGYSFLYPDVVHELEHALMI